MKKYALFFVLGLMLSAVGSSAQSLRDTITVKNRLGPVYFKEDKVLKPRQMVRLMEPMPEAHGHMVKAKKSFDLGSAVGAVGGALIGWPLGTLIAGGDPEWELAGIGAGLVVVSIPFSGSYNRNSRKAVGLYNKSLRQREGLVGSTHNQ